MNDWIAILFKNRFIAAKIHKVYTKTLLLNKVCMESEFRVGEMKDLNDFFFANQCVL